jgi:hypothetical protein
MTSHDTQSVSQPGLSPGNSGYSVTSLHSSPDFILATAGAALVDRELRLLLHVHFRQLTADEHIALFDEGRSGILSTFEGKIRLAYAAGFLEKEAYEDLLLVGTVRNLFVHYFEPVRFNSERIEKICSSLSINRNQTPRTGVADAREAFYETLLNLQTGLQFDRRGDLSWAV